MQKEICGDTLSSYILWVNLKTSFFVGIYGACQSRRDGDTSELLQHSTSDFNHTLRKCIPFGENNRENRSRRYWESFAHYKKNNKKEEITEGKIYSPVGKFAERAK